MTLEEEIRKIIHSYHYSTFYRIQEEVPKKIVEYLNKKCVLVAVKKDES